jgi:hypothetical protein
LGPAKYFGVVVAILHIPMTQKLNLSRNILGTLKPGFIKMVQWFQRKTFLKLYSNFEYSAVAVIYISDLY